MRVSPAGTGGPGQLDGDPGGDGSGTAPRTNLDQKSGTTSDKLGDTKGVITPTGPVDPAIEKPAPQSGPMPVIKPGDVGGGTAK